MIEKVTELLERCGRADPPMPPTTLYCEGWMLRIVLDWHEHHPGVNSPLAFARDAKWFSEGRLQTPFLPRPRHDKFGEGHTNADGFIGHFSITQGKRAEICPAQDATQLVVVEAKLGSKFSTGVKNAPYYDQAARNACCLTHIAAEATIEPHKLERFAFYVVAPESKINDIAPLVTKESIAEKVKRRASDYEKGPDWYEEKFQKFLNVMCIKAITWEEVLKCMESAGAGTEYREFYDECICWI